MYNLAPLDYEKILNIVARYCTSEVTKKRLLTIRPKSHGKDAERLFAELKEFIFVIERGIYPDLSRINDTSIYIERAKVPNSTLSLEELNQVRENIATFINIKKQFFPLTKEIPLLSRIAGSIRIPHHLKEKIDKAIDVRGNMREDATPELFEIVSKIKAKRQEIEKILEGYLNSPENKRYLQERHITLKDDRYVIPLKQNFKGKIPGIIHAHSGSGETIFVEPFSVTEKNNELRLLEKEREREVHRILLLLTREVGKSINELGHIQDVLEQIDILFAKHRFMEDYHCTIPLFNNERKIEIRGGRHPLIEGEVVPVDFEVKKEKTGTVVTGPNTGGKTVLLKTIGLFVALAKAGFPVPANYMDTFPFQSIFTDIGDEQSIEQSLSTFSGHMKNIKSIIERADVNSLVLIDELGAGTDPVEGGAIGVAIFDYLIKKRIFTIVTTHYSLIKIFALNIESVEVASVLFDPETCKPTYKVAIGIPGRSNALDIARNLGIKKEVLDKTSEYIDEEHRSIDKISKSLADMEMELSRKREKVFMEEERLKNLSDEYNRKLSEIQAKENFIRFNYRRELEKLLSEYRKRLESTVKELKSSASSKSEIKDAKAEIDLIEKDFTAYEAEHQIGIEVKGVSENENLKEGDSVYINNPDGGRISGRVEEVKADKVTVRAGLVQLTVERKMVFLDRGDDDRVTPVWNYEPSRDDGIVTECDIRGMRYEEAMIEVVKFLDKAVLHNLETVSIIHGLGTGALRKGVWEILSKYMYAERYEYARPEQGGFGCTIVRLKT